MKILFLFVGVALCLFVLSGCNQNVGKGAAVYVNDDTAEGITLNGAYDGNVYVPGTDEITIRVNDELIEIYKKNAKNSYERADAIFIAKDAKTLESISELDYGQNDDPAPKSRPCLGKYCIYHCTPPGRTYAIRTGCTGCGGHGCCCSAYYIEDCSITRDCNTGSSGS
ncbi:MAG: hypothetical protein V1725_03455 [archaeon]